MDYMEECDHPQYYETQTCGSCKSLLKVFRQDGSFAYYECDFDGEMTESYLTACCAWEEYEDE